MFDVKGDALIRALSQRGGWPRTVTADDVEHGTKQHFAMEGRYGGPLRPFNSARVCLRASTTASRPLPRD